MIKELGSFLLKLLGLTALIIGVHYYIFATFFAETELYFPLWTIYLFNAGLVLIVFMIISYQASRGSQKTYNLFIILTLVKMALAIVFLLPLFSGKSENATLEAINFFIPYFIYLGFEIFQLNNFLQKQETK